MLLSFDTVAFGKIELNTDNCEVYFVHDDFCAIADCDGPFNSFDIGRTYYFSNPYNKRFCVEVARDLRTGEIYARLDVSNWREIGRLTVAAKSAV